jgi:hypothetical protein
MSFSPYELRDTLQGFEKYLNEGIFKWLAGIKLRIDNEGEDAVLPQDLPEELGAPLVQCARRGGRLVDWLSMLKSNRSEPYRSSGPQHVLHIAPGVANRELWTNVFHGWATFCDAKHEWFKCVELAPPLPPPTGTAQLPDAKFVDRLPDSTGILTVVAHNDFLKWLAVKSEGVSMVDLLRLLVGSRQGLIILLLCCGLSKAEVRRLRKLCRATRCHIIYSTEPKLRYMESGNPIPHEFAELAKGFTRIHANLPPSSAEPLTEPELSIETVCAVAKYLLPQSSLMDHPPHWIDPTGEEHVIGSSASAAVTSATTASSLLTHDDGISDQEEEEEKKEEDRIASVLPTLEFWNAPPDRRCLFHSLAKGRSHGMTLELLQKQLEEVVTGLTPTQLFERGLIRAETLEAKQAYLASDLIRRLYWGTSAEMIALIEAWGYQFKFTVLNPNYPPYITVYPDENPTVRASSLPPAGRLKEHLLESARLSRLQAKFEILLMLTADAAALDLVKRGGRAGHFDLLQLKDPSTGIIHTAHPIPQGETIEEACVRRQRLLEAVCIMRGTRMPVFRLVRPSESAKEVISLLEEEEEEEEQEEEKIHDHEGDVRMVEQGSIPTGDGAAKQADFVEEEIHVVAPESVLAPVVPLSDAVPSASDLLALFNSFVVSFIQLNSQSHIAGGTPMRIQDQEEEEEEERKEGDEMRPITTPSMERSKESGKIHKERKHSHSFRVHPFSTAVTEAVGVLERVKSGKVSLPMTPVLMVPMRVYPMSTPRGCEKAVAFFTADMVGRGSSVLAWFPYSKDVERPVKKAGGKHIPISRADQDKLAELYVQAQASSPHQPVYDPKSRYKLFALLQPVPFHTN